MKKNAVEEKTIIVIDDDDSMREGCRQTLEKEGYRVPVARDGRQGLQMVEEMKPSVVLVDLKMPGLNGIEVIKKIRAFDSRIITIVITGYATIESAVDAMRAGVFDYLSKPFDPEKLIRVVKNALEKSASAEQEEVSKRETKMTSDNFAAMLCNQLKSPAVDAIQWMEIINSSQAGSLTPSQKSVIERVYKEIESLSLLINDWLQLTQIESGAQEFEPKAVEIPEIIKAAWDDLADNDGHGRIDFQIAVEDNAQPVLGHARLLQDLFKNLFNNTINFTSGLGKLSVSVSSKGENTIISVTDTGMGIPEEELTNLFNPFYRGLRSDLRRDSETRLGLAAVKRIASVHKGTIQAESGSADGATFIITLPVAKSGVAAAAPVTASKLKILDADQFARFVDRMIAEMKVIGVKAKPRAENRFVFAELESAEELRLDYDLTILPPKKFFLPQQETLVNFTMGDCPEIAANVPAPEPAVLVGVHPYDMVAVNQLDFVMSQGNADQHYLARRQAMAIIGIDPAKAHEKAFWSNMGCGQVDKGYDLWLTEIGGAYVVEVATARGEELLGKYADARDITEKELAARDQAHAQAAALGKRELEFTPEDLPELLRANYDHPVWEEKAEKCLSCGSCNLVCPTCYCFDVKDEINLSLKEGERYRVWDGCLLQDFASVAGGENFREERARRYRHRFYRKGMYLHDKYGQVACVGCGRCVTACLPDIADPVALYNTIAKSQVAGKK